MTEKLYYSIGEVAQMLDVNVSLLRFWETQFPTLHPHKNKKGDRYYTTDDIELLRRIYHLSRNCGFKLDAIREQLRRTTPDDERAQIVKTLTQTRNFLLQLKEQL